MTPKIEDTTTFQLSQAEFQELLHQKLCDAVRFTLVNILEAEVEALLGAKPYWKASLEPGKRVLWPLSIGTSLPMVPILTSSMTVRGKKCPF
jgi:hypothetical protein